MEIEYQTPGTNLWWSDISTWCQAAHRLDQRRFSSARRRALEHHVTALPLEMIKADANADALRTALELLKHGPRPLSRPQKGYRADAPQTARIMEIQNRLQVLRRSDGIPEGNNWTAMHPEH